MKKKIILFCLLLLVKSNYSKSQSTDFIKIAGNRFVHEDETPFYPMVMNYKLSYAYWNNQFLLSQDAGYRSHGFENPYGESNWSSIISSDMTYIKNMGFNAVRIGIYPQLNYAIDSDGNLKDPSIGPGWYFTLSIPTGGEFKLQIDPEVLTDANFQQVLENYVKILQYIKLGAPEMKVIFIMFGQQNMPINSEYWPSASEYLKRVAQRVAQSDYADMVLGFDIVNEPCYHFNLNDNDQAKENACTLISLFNDKIKEGDERFLTTIGNCAEGDYSVFDPQNMKVDYLSFHLYPDKVNSEDRYTNNIQSTMKTRFANNLLRFQKHTSKPWIIGETGFTASERQDQPEGDTYYPQQEVLHGSAEEQKDFLVFALRESYLAGAAGFSWWEFQDTRHYISNQFGNYWGVLELGGVPSLINEKHRITNIFRNYTPGVNPLNNIPFSGELSTDYHPVFNKDLLYYNPNKNDDLIKYNCPPISNPNQIVDILQTIEGRVLNAVTYETLADAPVFCSTVFGRIQVAFDDIGTPLVSEAEFVDKQSNYYTYSDAYGYFRLLIHGPVECAKDQEDITYHHNRGFRRVDINSHGLYERFSFFNGEYSIDIGQDQFFSTFSSLLTNTNYTFFVPEIDMRNKSFSNISLPSPSLSSGANNLIMADEKIAINSCAFNSSISGINFKAGLEISFEGEIDVSNGIELEARLGPIDKFSCSGIHSPSQRISNSFLSDTNIESEQKTLFLQFKVLTSLFDIHIYPVPANNYLEFKIEGVDEYKLNNYLVRITDVCGRLLLVDSYASLSNIIEISNLLPGAYLINFTFSDKSVKTLKFIKQ
jgi:hypothetical protein